MGDVKWLIGALAVWGGAAVLWRVDRWIAPWFSRWEDKRSQRFWNAVGMALIGMMLFGVVHGVLTGFR